MEQNDTEQNVLAARLTRSWDDFKRGKILSYKLMALVLILVATIGSTWYILHERAKANSQRWVSLEEANSISSLEDISKSNPNTIQDRLARFQIARNQLGIAGIDQLGAADLEQRKKAIENIEKARESLLKLVGEFNEDPILKAECLLGLAKAEASLIPVPVKEGQLTEFKGSLPKVVEWLDQFTAACAPGSPWAIESKKLADSLRDPNSESAHEFVRIEQYLFRPLQSEKGPGLGGDLTMPTLPSQGGAFGGFPKGSEPFIPGVPLQGGSPPIFPGNPETKLPSGSTPPPSSTPNTSPALQPPMPPGPQAPSTPNSQSPPPTGVAPSEPLSPIAPPPKSPDAKGPAAPPPMPQSPEPSAPIAPKPPEKK